MILSIQLLCAGSGYSETGKYNKSIEEYRVPDVTLVNQDGKKVNIRTLLHSPQPVVLDFIFGSCTTICPLLSAGYSNLQQKYSDDVQKPLLVSISIDPENDDPRTMKAYLGHYRAKPGWEFLTGSRSDIDSVLKAFNAYIPNRKSHYPLTLIRVPADGKWVRLFGLLSSTELLEECRKAGMK
jgi:protein SCO1/2